MLLGSAPLLVIHLLVISLLVVLLLVVLLVLLLGQGPRQPVVPLLALVFCPEVDLGHLDLMPVCSD